MNNVTETIASPHWQIRELALVNWGTYDGGPHRFTFPVSKRGSLSLISGLTGVGKSTAIDALVILTMRARVSLNRASAGEDQDRRARDIYTYSRGYLGKVSEDGRERSVYLRGQDPETGEPQATWSYISAEFVSAFGDVLTVALVTWIAAGEPSRVTSQVWVLSDDKLDPLAAESVCADRITPASIRRVYPEARVVSENKESMRRVFHEITGTTLVSEDLIYRNLTSGGGSDINSLFRDSVLELPSSIEKAETFVSSYDQAIESFASARRVQKRNQDLNSIRKSFETFHNLERSRISFGRWALPSSERNAVTEGDRLAIDRWVAKRLLPRVLRSTESACKALEEATSRYEDAKTARERADQDVDDLRRQYLLDGGQLIDTIKEKMAALESERRQREKKAEALTALFSSIEERLPTSPESWKSRALLFDSKEGYEKRIADSNKKADALTVEIHKAKEALDEARSNLSVAESSGTRLTSEMRTSRRVLATASGLSEDEIVFGAELMDVRPEFGDWRLAVNVGFARIADTLFISTLNEREFRSKIEGTPAEAVGRRQRFEFVDLSRTPELREPDERMLSGRLKFDWKSPFAPFVAGLASRSSEDWRCAESSSELSSDGARRITKASQTKVGNTGAYGTPKAKPNFIGFVDEAYLRELRGHVATAESRHKELVVRKAAVQTQIGDINAERRLAEAVASTEWAEIDWWTVDHMIDSLRKQLEEARRSDDLAETEKRLNEAMEVQRSSYREEVERESEKESRENTLIGLNGWRDELERRSISRVDLTDVSGDLENAVLDAWELVSTGIADEPTLIDRDRLPGCLNKVYEKVRKNGLDLARAASDQGLVLRQRLRNFQLEYACDIGADLRGLGTEPDDAPLYFELIGQEENWAEALVSNQAEAIHRQLELLLGFAQSVRGYETDVSRSIRKIGSILAGYDFDREGGKLRVEPKFRTTARDSDFTRMVDDLLRDNFKEVSISRLREWEPTRREELIGRLGEIADRLRGDGSEAKRNSDPRRRFIAKVYVTHPDDRPDMVISDYSGSSGGERERIKAFITAAAMAYALNTPNDDRPRYAVMVYDEAFVKSDVKTTRMSVEALKGLGFQLIVSCPDSKLGAIHSLAESTFLTTRPELEGPAFINYDERVGDA